MSRADRSLSTSQATQHEPVQHVAGQLSLGEAPGLDRFTDAQPVAQFGEQVVDAQRYQCGRNDRHPR